MVRQIALLAFAAAAAFAVQDFTGKVVGITDVTQFE
jgi:hypothetical protein